MTVDMCIGGMRGITVSLRSSERGQKRKGENQRYFFFPFSQTHSFSLIGTKKN